MNSVEITNLTKIYNSNRFSKNAFKALDNVSLKVEEGQIFGLLGPNGAGKTTLIKILLGIVYPTAGVAKLLGKNIHEYKNKKHIGYLPENHRFPNYLTGEEIIYFYAKLNGYEIEKKSKEITEILKLVKMEQWGKIKIKKYSKGMMQRLGLAQAIIHKPKIVFLDEPTDGIDPIGRKEIRDILLKLKENGTTIFINSHLLSEVELISDKIAILNHGKLVKEGTVEELTTNKEIYEIKIQNILTEDSLEILEKNYKYELKDGSILLSTSNTTNLNNFMDDLRKLGINILSVNQKKTSLEDMFIKSLLEDK